VPSKAFGFTMHTGIQKVRLCELRRIYDVTD